MPEIRNPNLQTPGTPGGSGGGDLRSTWGFALLFIVILLGYQYFFKPKTDTTTPATTQSQSQAGTATAAANMGQSGATTANTNAAKTGAPSLNGQAPGIAPGATPAVVATTESETTVENELYKIVLTNRGAQVKHWILKKYFDTAGKPLDLVQPQTSAKFGDPLSFFTYEPALTNELNQSLYQVSGAGTSATGSVLAPAAITYHYAANGIDAVKTLRFDSSYVISVETEVKRNGSPVRALVQWPSGLGDMEEFLPASLTRGPTVTPSFFAWSVDGKQDTMAAAKVSSGATLNGAYGYAAIEDLYFASAFLPENPAGTSVVTLHNSIDLPSNLSDPNSQKKPAHVLGVAIGDASGYTKLRLYAGPKAMDVLAAIHAMGADGKPTGPSLEPLINFSWLTLIAKPLYLALRFLNEHGVPNWGWDIIIITVIFNLLMLPTRLMMMRSSLKMMRIQPKVDALKARYAHLKATDPKRAEMNTELMELYKTENVNMYGGCLPLLIQMPLFFAYYRVLANVIDLRQAHWFWLHDLSVADPLYILAAIIIVSMFLVQWLTPSPGMDPNQRRMMAIMMPVIFGYSMSHFASGLALYWGTGNVINLGIQLAINKSSMGKEMHEIAAKRAARKLGNSRGKTIQGRK